MTAFSSKGEMRRHYKNLRDDFTKSVSANDETRAFSMAPTPLKRLFLPGLIVAGYIPLGSEANPLNLLRAAHSLGCRTALPHVISMSSPIRFLEWSPDDHLEKGSFNLMQPSLAQNEVTPDVVLVPLVAFDRSLARLGQGAGHYDRALSILEGAVAIGIAWSVQEADRIPADPWDIPLDAILTEREWITI